MSEVVIKQCPYCGIEFKTNTDQKFCSKACSNRGRQLLRREDFDPNLDWRRTNDKEKRWECPYHGFVSCKVRNCVECGWNPEIAKARSVDYERKLRGEYGK
jgi:hypothetical protein